MFDKKQTDRLFRKLNKEQYVPICRNWTIIVRIVRRVGVLYADFRSLKSHNLYYDKIMRMNKCTMKIR